MWRRIDVRDTRKDELAQKSALMIDSPLAINGAGAD